MKDFASCFSEHAVKVSDYSCSGSSSSSSGNKSSIISVETSSSVQTSITTLYRTHLATTSSSRKDLLIKVVWSKTPVGPILSVGVDHLWSPASSSSSSCGVTSLLLLRKRKGTRSYVSASTGSSIALYWDYSDAKFDAACPEPASNFCIIVMVDAELGLLLGDLATDAIKRIFTEEALDDDNTNTSAAAAAAAELRVVSRKEQVVVKEMYSTRARLSEEGKEHEIVIRCRGGELMVSVDKKRVVEVRRLDWNFRGNHTIFVDGWPIDIMWDVRDWCSSFTTTPTPPPNHNPPGYAVFMFRKRSTLDSRLWFEEEERGIAAGFGFSLLIQAFKTPTPS